ncbi:dihydroxyacetone kinase subunit L [Lactobacillus taiwanensis]|nr:dihydroxyacetone kinase subunit L [Lactobacillus taiwanensis]
MSRAVASTKCMVAKKGCARYLCECAKGHVDPGAESS